MATVKRAIGAINPKELEEVLVGTFKTFLNNNKPLFKDGFFEISDIKAMDGKTANSSSRKSSKDGEVAKMNAMSIILLRMIIVKLQNLLVTKQMKSQQVPFF